MRLWPSLFGASLLVGLATGLIGVIALPFIFALALGCYFVGQDHEGKRPAVLALALLATLLLSLMLALHLAPGFHNLAIAKNFSFGHDALPYDLYWNYDKGLAGFLLLALCVPTAYQCGQWRRVPIVVLGLSTLLVLTLMPLTMVLGYVRFDPKLPEVLLWWLPANLLITAAAEEAFFRGLIQRRLSRWWSSKTPYGSILAILVSAVLFGVAHWSGGAAFALIATAVGLGYGYAYHLTGRIESSILVHFLFNLSHLILFSYPCLGANATCSSSVF